MNGNAPRSYRSVRRAEQAAATRLRVIDAAAGLFAADGYARTTLAAIAARAGVSVETVQAQGPKRELLGAALQRVTLGGASPAPLLEAPEARPLVDAATPEAFAGAAGALMADFNARTAAIWRAFGSAAADDPVVDEEWTRVMAGVRVDVKAVVALLDDRGWLRADVPHDELTASLWILVGSETFEKLTVRLGWPPARYRAWLARSITDLLLR
jgi:AcrR family transcriptional regulator